MVICSVEQVIFCQGVEEQHLSINDVLKMSEAKHAVNPPVCLSIYPSIHPLCRTLSQKSTYRGGKVNSPSLFLGQWEEMRGPGENVTLRLVVERIALIRVAHLEMLKISVKLLKVPFVLLPVLRKFSLLNPI